MRGGRRTGRAKRRPSFAPRARSGVLPWEAATARWPRARGGSAHMQRGHANSHAARQLRRRQGSSRCSALPPIPNTDATNMGGRLFPPMRAWLEQPHGRRHKAPPQPCVLTTSTSTERDEQRWRASGSAARRLGVLRRPGSSCPPRSLRAAAGVATGGPVARPVLCPARWPAARPYRPRACSAAASASAWREWRPMLLRPGRSQQKKRGITPESSESSSSHCE